MQARACFRLKWFREKRATFRFRFLNRAAERRKALADMADIRPATGGDERMQTRSYVAAQANQLPVSFAEGVKAYFGQRKREIVAGLEDLKGYELDEVRAKLYAHEELKSILGVTEETSEADIKRASRKVRKKIVKERPETYLAHLYSVLTPPGWRDKIGPDLNTYIELCEEKVISDDDAINARAGIEEAKRLFRYLVNTERMGSDATAMLQLKRASNGR